MQTRINSATRLHNILDTAFSQKEGTQSFDVWLKIVDPDSRQTRNLYVVVSEAIIAMNGELAILREQTNEIQLPREIYENDLLFVENVISPHLLFQPWLNVRSQITPEVLKSLSYLIHLLPDEELEISESDFSDISELISRLKILLEDASISVRLKKLIQHHIALVERATFEYKISGAKVLREAAYTAVGEMITLKDEFKNEKGSKFATALGALWSKVNKTTDIALRVGKAEQLLSSVSDSIDWLT